MSTQMGNADRQIGAGVAAAPCDALFADLCELTMLQTYFAQGMEDQAVFSLFVRRLPERRKYLLACGLDTVLDYLDTCGSRPTTHPQACPPATPRVRVPVAGSCWQSDASPRRTPSTNAIGPSSALGSRPEWPHRI